MGAAEVMNHGSSLKGDLASSDKIGVRGLPKWDLGSGLGAWTGL